MGTMLCGVRSAAYQSTDCTTRRKKHLHHFVVNEVLGCAFSISASYLVRSECCHYSRYWRFASAFECQSNAAEINLLIYERRNDCCFLSNSNAR